MKIVINLKKPIYDINKIIKFQTTYSYEFSIDSNIKMGGDIFDDINLDDIIIKKEEDIIKPKETKKNNIGEINPALIKKHNIKRLVKKDQSNEVIIFKLSNIVFNKLNTIYDIKLLIFYLLNIPIENQNLFDNTNPDLFYSYNNNITTEILNINIEHYIKLSNVKYFQNIPIDFDLVNNRLNFIIYTYEKNKYLQDINDNLIELNLIILDDFIIDKNKLYKEIQNDDDLLNILYKGFIEKYFPYYDTNLFLLFLLNENKNLEYPNLNIKSDTIITKNEKLSNILNQNFKQIDKILNLSYKKLIYYIPSFNTNKNLNIKELFNNIELKKVSNLKKIELQLEIQNDIIYFSKQNIFSVDKKLNENLKNENILYIINKNYNSLVDSIYLSNNIILFIYTISDTNKDIYIILDEYLNIHLIYNLSEYTTIEDNVTKLDWIEEKILQYLNHLFQDFYLLKIFNKKHIFLKNNMELLLIDKQILINQNISANLFQKLYLVVSNLEIVDFYNINNYDELNNIINLNIKHIKYNSIFDSYLNQLSNNFYNFYTKYELTEKYNKLLYSSHVTLTNRIKDIKVDIVNINHNDLPKIIYLLKFILSKVLNNETNIQDSSSKFVTKNKLKKLKEIDPILYAINKKNTKNLYSRKCQANQQPDIIDEKSAKKNKNHIKYINFTTGEPIYYTCNNKKFPNVKFLTNLHPQNFCIPCCKKKAIEDVKVKSKYISIHNECLTTYKFDKKNKVTDEKSRYIMNYSSKVIIENLRLMQIPDSLYKLFNKTFEDINSQKDLNYYILGLNQNIGNIAYIGILTIMSFILNKTINDILNFIKELFIKDPNFINIIYDSKLLNHFQSSKDFLTSFTNIFQDKVLLYNVNFEFNEWNELFIDICKYLGYIVIIFEEYEINEVSNLNLIVPPNIQHINEYIFNNDSYQYILLIKRNYKDNILYYPIIKTNYIEYYNDNIFYNKTYTYDNQIIKLIAEIIKNKIIVSNHSLSLSLIEEYILMSKTYHINTYFINNKYEIYSILISNNDKKYIYLNIKQQKILNDDSNINSKLDKKYSLDYINISKYNIQLNDILNFINKYNKYLYSKNKNYYTEFFYKSYINNLPNTLSSDTLSSNTLSSDTLSSDTIKNLYTYIYISNFVIYNNKIIGLQLNINSSNYNCYISTPLDKSIGEKLIINKAKEYKKILENKKIHIDDIIKLITREFKSNIYSEINLIYNPHNINNIIYSKKIINDIRIQKLNEAIYHTNLYNLFILHFTNKLFQIKNSIIRTKLKHLINNLDISDINLIISNKFNKISDIIIKYVNSLDTNLMNRMIYNISDFIKNIINQNLDNKLSSKVLIDIKKKIISNLDNNMFLFDNILIYNILDMEKEEAIKELNTIFNDIIINTNIQSNNNNNNLDLCNNLLDSYFCKDNKLIISKEIYNEFLDILYYDLTNPFKQKLILNLVNYNLNNIYNFKQFINEKIYIYI
jgi:hypothetical protein